MSDNGWTRMRGDTKGKCGTCKTVVVWTGGAGRAVWMAYCPVCGTKLERTCAEPKGFTWVRQEPVFKVEGK